LFYFYCFNRVGELDAPILNIPLVIAGAKPALERPVHFVNDMLRARKPDTAP
jgi:hypothetical protein